MAWVLPVIQGIGAATSLGQGVASGKAGAQDAQSASDYFNKSGEGFSDLQKSGSSGLESLLGLIGQLGGAQANTLRDDIYNGTQAAASGLGDVNRNAADQVQRQNVLGDIRSLSNQSSGEALSTLLGGLGGFQAPNVNVNQAQGLNPTRFTPDQYSFDNVRATRQQAMNDFKRFAADQRMSGLEQAAQGFSQFGDALNEQLASRGLSANSGQAGAALGQFAGQQGQALANLNRDLSAQAGQLGLQASQFDVTSGLQQSQLGSNYNLGFNQLGQSANDSFYNQAFNTASLDQQGQLGLGGLQGQYNGQAAQLAGQGLAYQQSQVGNLLGLQNAINQNIELQRGYNAGAFTDPLQLQQGVYQQNYLAPMLQTLGILSPSQTLATGSSGQAEIGKQYQDSANKAGSGKGSGVSGAISGAESAASSAKGDS